MTSHAHKPTLNIKPNLSLVEDVAQKALIINSIITLWHKNAVNRAFSPHFYIAFQRTNNWRLVFVVLAVGIRFKIFVVKKDFFFWRMALVRSIRKNLSKANNNGKNVC